LLPAL